MKNRPITLTDNENYFIPGAEDNELITNSKLKNDSSLLYDKYYQPWTQPQLLSELQNIDFQTSLNIIQLFEKDNTIPFICRYRKELIGDITPDG